MAPLGLGVKREIITMETILGINKNISVTKHSYTTYEHRYTELPTKDVNVKKKTTCNSYNMTIPQV